MKRKGRGNGEMEKGGRVEGKEEEREGRTREGGHFISGVMAIVYRIAAQRQPQ
jgi:hypothetical protein